MIIVADTSPINYLVLIKEIEVLPRLYGKIVIPEAVREELLRPEAPRDCSNLDRAGACVDRDSHPDK